MKLVMTLLVRDEQDIIRENIEFHLAQGVDFIIATDNRSVDETTNILKEYEARGLLHYIYEGSDNYNQHAWVTRMARMAYLDYGADWVINNDADEFWWPVELDLKETFKRIPPEINQLRANRHNYVVVQESDEPFWSRMVYHQKVSLNPLDRPLPPKVAHRGSAQVKIQQGNHSVEGIDNPMVIDKLIEIFHFPIRNYQQIENKIAKGGAAYERNQELPKSTGMTWRKLYDDLQRDSHLNSFFDKNYYGQSRLEKNMNLGNLIEDRSLAEYFSKNLNQ